MNIFQLVLKQMRQRALSTWLTLLSVIIGVALAIGVLILQREGAKLFVQGDFGYDFIIGPPKGSPLQLTLNTVYHLDKSPGPIPFRIYEEMISKDPPAKGRPNYRQLLRWAVPFMVGDSYLGQPLIGTSPLMFGADEDGKPLPADAPCFEYRKDIRFEFAEGRSFAGKKFEAVIGSEIAEKFAKYKLKIGSTFQATHGFPGPNEKPDIHNPKWAIVGILKPTHTANDRTIFLPFISLLAIAEHEDGMLVQALMREGIDPSKIKPEELDGILRKLGYDPAKVPASALKTLKQKISKPQGELLQDKNAPKVEEEPDEDAFKLDADGNITPDLPKEEWELNAVLVHTRAPIYHQALEYMFMAVISDAAAVKPAEQMRDFFENFMKPSSETLLVVSYLVMLVAAVSILVSIYNSVSARIKEIAILRALGATRTTVLTLICLEAGFIGLMGGIIGVICGHVLGAIESFYFARRLGSPIEWYKVSGDEWLLLFVAVILSLIAGIVPGLKAYRASVASQLTGG